MKRKGGRLIALLIAALLLSAAVPRRAEAAATDIEGFVDRLYTVVLGREPDKAGRRWWVRRLNTGRVNASEAAMGFFTSEEYRKRNKTRTAFLEDCYRTLLDRPSDPEGKRWWMKQLADGKMDRRQVVAGFANSNEFRKLCRAYGLSWQLTTKEGFVNGQKVGLAKSWKYAANAEIRSGQAVLYVARKNRKEITVAVNAGHGTKGSYAHYTWCHPDHSAKVTGGTTAAGSLKAVSVSSGMDFPDGTPESRVTLRMARTLRDRLLAAGYDVLMLRNDTDVQLDNVARTVIANNAADCHIALHWDDDGFSYDKGCYYCSVPSGIRSMTPVKETWRKSHALGSALLAGLRAAGNRIYGNGTEAYDLTQTSYSTVPSVVIELGNQRSDRGDAALKKLGKGLVKGFDRYFGY